MYVCWETAPIVLAHTQYAPIAKRWMSCERAYWACHLVSMGLVERPSVMTIATLTTSERDPRSSLQTHAPCTCTHPPLVTSSWRCESHRNVDVITSRARSVCVYKPPSFWIRSTASCTSSFSVKLQDKKYRLTLWKENIRVGQPVNSVAILWGTFLR